MKTAIHANKKIYAIEQVLAKAFPSRTIPYSHAIEQPIELSHKGHSVAYFLWTFVVIFSSIAVALIIAEKFFFQY